MNKVIPLLLSLLLLAGCALSVRQEISYRQINMDEAVIMMEEEIYTVKLSKIIEQMHLEKLYTTTENEDAVVTTPDVNRPSLQITGFYDYFDNTRLQLLGKVEYTYLMSLSP